MSPLQIQRITTIVGFLLVRATCLAILWANGALAGGSGPMPGLNTTTPYLIYYGNWNSSQVDYARTNYHLVILHPASNITSNQIATIKRGKDNIAGTADDVLVLAYLSIGEDDRTGVPFVGDGLGPRVDPRASDSAPLSSITNAIGLPSSGGTHYASYYLNARNNQTGIPDQDASWGSYYVNAGAPAWWNVIKNMTKASSGQAGLDEILSTNVGNAFNCDGVFLDTIDTAAPDTWGTEYEWTSPGMQGLVQRIRTNYVGKLIMANRGLFFYDPNVKTYPYTLRPYVDMVMFESYYSDSSTNAVSTSFLDNKYDFAPKINAEAGRPDGFTVLAVDYDHTPPQSSAIVNQDYVECMGIQGWPLYRTNPYLDEALNTNSAAWLATNADTQPPLWDSTAAQSPTPPTPRVGVQEVTVGDQSATVYWDVAHDQTEPVRYNVYYSSGAAMNFQTATKLTHVSPSIPESYTLATGPGIYPYAYTITGLTNEMTYFFAVRAEDSSTPSHEDANAVNISAVPGTSGAVGAYRNITIDGTFSDWAGLAWAYQGNMDTNPVNFAEVQFANDTNYLYGHVKLYSPYALFSDYYTHLFIDTDDNSHTGCQITGVLFGSEMMIESGFGYDERNGTFNAGNVSGLDWAIDSGASGTEFEFRVSLASLYSDGTRVFGTNAMRLLMQDDRGHESAVETGIPYILAAPRVGPLFISGIGSQVTITWSGSGALQVSSSLAVGSWTNVPSATSPYTIQAGMAQQFFRLGE
ncbi:MAG: fibronectin type III domain-containing protein [Verrucomicrobiota bacterium]|jgi:hypothetical protein